MEKLKALEAVLQANLVESPPQYVSAISEQLRRCWGEIEVLNNVHAVESDDELAERRDRVGEAMGRLADAKVRASTE